MKREELYPAFKEAIDFLKEHGQDGTVRKVEAALTALQEEAGRVSVPREVRDWQEAERIRIAAVETYNARVEYARAHREFGAVSCDPEYQEMCRTQKAASSLLKPMYEALSAAPAPAAQDAHDDASGTR